MKSNFRWKFFCRLSSYILASMPHAGCDSNFLSAVLMDPIIAKANRMFVVSRQAPLQDLRQEFPRPRVPWICEDPLRRVVLEDAPPIHEQHPRRQFETAIFRA